ncbi:MAG: DUF3006 domain-containing protein [Armatimonadetes bacterium]|nr:DUF3006 domain-containing protein [Armatimonadota bacterium]
MAGQKAFRAFVDRIENGKAVLIIGAYGKYQLIVPKDLLPEGADEGSVLSIIVRLDEEQSERVRERAQEMIQELIKKDEE